MDLRLISISSSDLVKPGGLKLIDFKGDDREEAGKKPVEIAKKCLPAPGLTYILLSTTFFTAALTILVVVTGIAGSQQKFRILLAIR